MGLCLEFQWGPGSGGLIPDMTEVRLGKPGFVPVEPAEAFAGAREATPRLAYETTSLVKVECCDHWSPEKAKKLLPVKLEPSGYWAPIQPESWRD